MELCKYESLMLGYKHDMFGTIRSFVEDGQRWFMLKDVLRAIDISRRSKSFKKLNDWDSKMVSVIMDMSGDGRVREYLFVNESAVYTFLLEGDEARSQLFRQWLATQFLPTNEALDSYKIDKALPVVTNHLKIMDHALKSGDYAVANQEMYHTMQAMFKELNDKDSKTFNDGLSKVLIENPQKVIDNGYLTNKPVKKRSESIPSNIKKLFYELADESGLDIDDDEDWEELSFCDKIYEFLDREDD